MLHSALEHSRSHACCEVGLLLLCLISPLSSPPAPEAKLSGTPWAPPHPCSLSWHVHEGKQGPRRAVLRQDVPAQPEAMLAVVLALRGSRGGPALPCPVCSRGGLRERPAESPRWQPLRRAGRAGPLCQRHLWGVPRQWTGAAQAPATFSGGFLFYHAHPRPPTSTSPVPQLSVCKGECLPGLEGSFRRGSPLPRLPIGCSSGRTWALGSHCWGAGVARGS